ncbi:hypothetical protein RJ639_039015 [Escallonia herrerae]|uniref:DUF7788 domain-containing protein n=1 Tax=Escallonia herrerae TaxID=1293975 RepID=A0AA89B3I3_9ASTE|nr:hypothetical protein RJ639_039015 [Escallonia herrerae]
MAGAPLEVSVAVGLLISELSEEPWKGKLITFGEKPRLISVEEYKNLVIGHHRGTAAQGFLTTRESLYPHDWHMEFTIYGRGENFPPNI